MSPAPMGALHMLTNDAQAWSRKMVMKRAAVHVKRLIIASAVSMSMLFLMKQCCAG